MKRRRKLKKQIVRILSWSAMAAAAAAVVMICLSWLTFREIELLMTETPTYQPTLIYSDTYVVQKGQYLNGTFLPARLKGLDIRYSETQEDDKHVITWKSTRFNHPESVLESSSPLRPTPGSEVRIEIENGKIEALKVNDEDVEGIALEPTLIAQIAGQHKSIRDYLKLDDIPTVLKEAIISIEDQRFREHHGFDVKSLARAMVVNLRARSMAQGGSTITQQLVKNLLKANKKTLSRKLKELVLAILIEAKYEKEQILEKYLNEVYFGQIGALEVHGVADAARYFFNKSLDQLSISEMAMMAGVIRGPAVYSPYRYKDRAKARRDTVLKKLFEQHYIAAQEYETAVKEDLVLAKPNQGRNMAPYFVDYVKAQVLSQLQDRISEDDLETQGLRIYTTLDIPIQRAADAAVASTVKELEARLKIAPPLRLEGLLAAADPNTGAIRALVGGRSYGETTFNRILNMKRQAGSTFKPIVYLSAFLKGNDQAGMPYTASYLIDDEPFTHKYEAGQTWTPKNYEKTFRGRITLREAFANSVNTAAAKIGIDVGLENVIETAQKLGVTTKLEAVPSLSLGTVDMGAIELLQVYSTFAAKGTRNELTAVKIVTDKDGATVARFQPRSEQVIETPYIELLTNLLRSVVTEGTAKILPKLGYNGVAYGKTGTTSFYRDSWFTGFSDGLAAVAWVGFDELKLVDSVARKDLILTGATGALPLWARFFSAALPPHPEQNVEEIEEPAATLERVEIDKTKNCRATNATNEDDKIYEFYLPGTLPQECP